MHFFVVYSQQKIKKEKIYFFFILTNPLAQNVCSAVFFNSTVFFAIAYYLSVFFFFCYFYGKNIQILLQSFRFSIFSSSL